MSAKFYYFFDVFNEEDPKEYKKPVSVIASDLVSAKIKVSDALWEEHTILHFKAMDEVTDDELNGRDK